MRIIKMLIVLMIPATLSGQQLSSEVLSHFNYRNLGAYRVGAWISAIAVPETNDPAYAHTFYVAARNGGVWKTENRGTTFKPIFDDQNTTSIGDVAIAPSNPEIVWVGTGEDYNARSSYSGTGIYKSMNGGDDWEYMGLSDSHHISEIIIHPTNPDIVYVAVMGHLFSDNTERGVYKTRDGGKTWSKVFFVDNETGIIDLAIDPRDPNVLYTVAYFMDRSPWHFEAGGEQSGIYKTVDGGDNWNQLKNGLPEGKIGRIGIDIALSDPDQLYAVYENLNMTSLSQTELEVNKDNGITTTEKEIGGEVYHSTDAGMSWVKVNPEDIDVSSKAAYSFNEIFVNPQDPKNIFVLSETLSSSPDGGKTWEDANWPPRRFFTQMFGDVRTMWIDPRDSRHMIIGSDGGVYVTFDAGRTVDHLYNIPLGEIYNVAVDNEEPYNVYLGYQDHEIWKGPSNSWSGRVTLEDWTIVGLWDGMYTQVSFDNRWLYVTSQFGAHHRVDQKTGTRKRIEPQPKNLDNPYRYTWDTPILISPHDQNTVYTGGQMLLKSTDQGDNWEEISPDLTDNDSIKIAGKGHIQYCTITTISESPLKEGLIWVGTDDGRVHRTTNGGAGWIELTQRLVSAGAPRDRWVSRVVTSSHNENTVYVTKSGYRRDDFRPFIYKSTDNGESWVDISSNLPNAPISIMVEDHKNPNLLFVGNDIGVFVSIDGGENWNALKGNMPNVPIRDLVVHPRENDLVVGTYGRGAFVTDITVLQEMSESILDSDYHLFDIESKPINWSSKASNWGNHELSGNRHLTTPNEPTGMLINYHIKETTLHDIEITISEEGGKLIDTIYGKNKAGLHQIRWFNWAYQEGATYKVKIKIGDWEQEKVGILKEALQYSVPNFRGKN